MRQTARAHPIGQILNRAASGGTPTNAELDALHLPATVTRRLAKKATEIVAVRLNGENQAADDWADQGADELIASLEPELQNPRYREDAAEAANETTDPAELAKGVQRW